MPEWGKIFADPGMQSQAPDPALMELLPVWQAAGCNSIRAGSGARLCIPGSAKIFPHSGMARSGKKVQMPRNLAILICPVNLLLLTTASVYNLRGRSFLYL